jgi:hypothetical protein
MSWQKSVRLDGGFESVQFGFMALKKGAHYSLSPGLYSVRFRQVLVQAMHIFRLPE